MILCGMAPPLQVEIGLPDGVRVVLPVEQAEGDTNAACARLRRTQETIRTSRMVVW